MLLDFPAFLKVHSKSNFLKPFRNSKLHLSAVLFIKNCKSKISRQLWRHRWSKYYYITYDLFYTYKLLWKGLLIIWNWGFEVKLRSFLATISKQKRPCGHLFQIREFTWTGLKWLICGLMTLPNRFKMVNLWVNGIANSSMHKTTHLNRFKLVHLWFNSISNPSIHLYNHLFGFLPNAFISIFYQLG